MAGVIRTGISGGRVAVLALLLGGLTGSMANALPRSPDPAGLFKERWIDGTLAQEPVAQVQALDADTFVIRQSVKTNFEAPFLYLLFGRDRALLIDTGAEGGVIRPVVDRLIAERMKARGKASLPLIVAHSHAHGDHIAGDAAFRARADTTVVGLSSAEVAAFFGIDPWPDAIASYDLGGRRLQIIPTPGHQKAAMMVYDPRLRILISGDTLYPGRLYVPLNFVADNRASLERLTRFARQHPIRAVLGAHIEMTQTPGEDYPHEALTHPAEHPLELPAGIIAQVRSAMAAPIDATDDIQRRDHFIIVPVEARVE